MAIIFPGTTCRSPVVNSQTLLIDSLLEIAAELQVRISSPEIQQLGDLYRQVEDDLDRLTGLSHQLSINEQHLLNDYQVFDNQLGECFQACGKFHEELFMTETNLRELHSVLEKKKFDQASVQARILTETEMLRDLAGRLKNALSVIPEHQLHYNELKPRIDSVITRCNDMNETDE